MTDTGTAHSGTPSPRPNMGTPRRYRLASITSRQRTLVSRPGRAMSARLRPACELTSALAGVPTGSMKAYEQERVTGMRKSSGCWPRLRAISLLIGRKMVAMAELEASSVVKEARKLMADTTSGTGRRWRTPSWAPISFVRPELCRKKIKCLI